MPLAFWFVLAVAHLPLLPLHFSWMWRQEAYHYLPALGLALALLIAIRWDRVLRLPDSPGAWALLLVSSILILPAAIWSCSPWLGALALVISLGSFLVSQRRATEAGDERSLFSLWPLAWLLLPLPMNLDQSLTAGLQLQSSQLSSYLLDVFEIPHMLLGNVIELPSGRLFVEEACSGVQSLYTLIFCAVLIVAVLDRAMCLLPAYIALAILWAGLMNVARIVTVGAVRHWYGLDWSHGWRHSLIGYVALTAAVLLLLSSDRLMRVFFFPTKPDAIGSPRSNPLVALWNYLFGNEEPRRTTQRTVSVSSMRAFAPGLMAVVIGLLLWQSVQAVNRMREVPPVAKGPKPPFLKLPETIPAGMVPGFVQAMHERVRGNIDLPMGENADVWRGTVAGVPVAIAVNQPYPSWHDLTICYRATGWQLNDQEILVAPESGKQLCDYTVSRWITDQRAYAYVWFCAFDDQGEHVERPDRSLLARLRFRAGRRYDAPSDQVAMVQMVVESDSALAPDVMSTMTEAFLASRQFLCSIAKPNAGKQAN